MALLKSNPPLVNWNPDEPGFWNNEKLRIANRNLYSSVFNLITAFMVWMMWSGLVVYLKQTRPDLTTSQMYWLTGIPMLSAGFLRIVYSFIIPNFFGGKTWTIISTMVLAPPLLWSYFRIDSPDTSFLEFSMIAFLCGLAGANFASSCASVSLFYPKKYKGLALGVNAAIGNLGVGIIQFAIPILVTTNLGIFLSGDALQLEDGTLLWMRNIPILLLFPVIFGSILAYYTMDNIVFHGSSFKRQLGVLKNKHSWIMSFLYTATFGSFIGFAAVFPILLETQFPGSPSGSLAFLGATLSSLMRPIGHVVCLKINSVRLTNIVFCMMVVALGMASTALPTQESQGNFWIFILSYFGLFIGTGLGKGSTTHMIPEIFHSLISDQTRASRHTAAIIGFTSAIATIGAFFIPPIFTVSIETAESTKAALYTFMAIYLLCIIVTWVCYQRNHPNNPLNSYLGHSTQEKGKTEDRSTDQEAA